MHSTEAGVLAKWLAVLVAAAAVGEASCYRPSFHDCQLQCTESAGCPLELVCLGGYCRVDVLPDSVCPAHDGGLGLADADDDGADAPFLIDASDVADSHTVADAHIIDARVPDARVLADARIPDAATPDAACTCNPTTQSCCASGDACDLNASSQPECRDVSVAGQQAAVCTSPQECARSYTCIVAASSTLGTCHEFCSSDAQCVGGSALCDLRVGSSSLMACTSLCDPLSGSGCEQGWACELARSPATGRWHSDCRPAGNVPAGNACTRNSQCGRGYVCAGSPGRCAPYCNSQQDENGCPGTPTCQIGSDPPTLSGVSWGACL